MSPRALPPLPLGVLHRTGLSSPMGWLWIGSVATYTGVTRAGHHRSVQLQRGLSHSVGQLRPP